MKAKVLYIDDELDLLDLAASFFEDEKLPIQTCSDFHQALELIRKHQYDIIISDAKMPSGSGHELFSLIKKEGLFKGKSILVTGHLEENQQQIDYDLILYKPIMFQDLVDTVKRMLES